MQVFNATQRAEEGEKRLASWLATHPQDARTRAVLAENLIKRGQYKASVEHYLILNKSTPNNLVVLNNLAWALFESKDSRALGFAEQALKLKPDSPAVMDTLGWILVHQGQTDRGLKLLQQAHAQVPEDPSIHYNLAVALAKIGERAKARTELDRLLARGVKFEDQEVARALFAQLDGRR